MQIEVANGDGLTAPTYLRFDWRDSTHELFHDRRVPESGSLDPNARPLAVVRIAARGVADPERRIVIRGLVGDEIVSQAEAAVSLVDGRWQTTRVVLFGSESGRVDGGLPTEPTDGGARVDGGPSRGAADPTDAVLDLGPSSPSVDLRGPGLDVPSPDLRGPDLPKDLGGDLLVTLASSIPASADSYVAEGSGFAGMNFGKSVDLDVKTQTGNNYVAFLRFPLAGVTDSASLTAVLRVFGKVSVGMNMVSAYGVLDDTWTENEITWNNKPALAMKQSTVSVGPVAQYHDWVVTEFVKAQLAAGRDSVSFGLSMDNDTVNTPDNYYSREATSNQPRLLILR